MRERTSRRALTATTPAGRRVFRRMVSAGWLLQNSAGDSCMIEGGLGRRTSVLGAVLIAFALAGCTTKPEEIGRAHVCTPVTNAHLVCRLLLENKNNIPRT